MDQSLDDTASDSEFSAYASRDQEEIRETCLADLRENYRIHHEVARFTVIWTRYRLSLLEGYVDAAGMPRVPKFNRYNRDLDKAEASFDPNFSLGERRTETKESDMIIS